MPFLYPTSLSLPLYLFIFLLLLLFSQCKCDKNKHKLCQAQMRFKEDNAALEIIFPRDAKIFREGGTQYWCIYIYGFIFGEKQEVEDWRPMCCNSLSTFPPMSNNANQLSAFNHLKSLHETPDRNSKRKRNMEKKKHTHTIKQNRRWLWDMVCVCGCDSVFISIITAHITPLPSRAPSPVSQICPIMRRQRAARRAPKNTNS